MHFTLRTIALVALLGEAALGAPVQVSRQLAGTGSACDSVVSDFDTMLGTASRGAGENLANGLAGAGLRRQLAGTGSACNSVVSDFDTMVGDASRGSGENLANGLSQIGAKRQLNGIADGLTAPLKDNELTSGLGDSADTFLNNVDGTLTNDQAEIGQQIGDAEVNLGNTIAGQSSGSSSSTSSGGGAPPPPPPPGPGHKKRQLNGIADGITAPLKENSATSSLGDGLDSYLNAVDGGLTNGQAELGQQLGEDEVGLGETIASGGSSGGSSSSTSGGGGQAPPPPPPPRAA